jgi:hypothetical protein
VVAAALDELCHPGLHAVAEGAGEHAEGGGGFALAVAGEHQHHAAVDIGRLDLFVYHRLLARHALGVAPVFIHFH